MTTLREVAQQALAFTMRDFASLRDFEAARAVLHDDLRAALAEQAEGGCNLPPPLQVPPEVAATLTTTDIAWLETRRLTKLWQELGQMRWAGADEGWDRAIEAVRSRLNDECQAVMYWKLTADKSQATAIELLQKMQGLKND
jgi:hypothetical protein